MPNLRPPVTTAAQALAYRDRIQAAVPAGVSFRAADDAVPDRQPAGRRDPAREGCWRGRRQALPRRRHHQQRRRRDRPAQDLQDAGGHAARRPAAAGAWRGDLARDRPVRPRGGVHRHAADPAAPRLPRAEDRVRAHHDEGGRAVRQRRGPLHRRHHHRAPPALQPQCHLHRRHSPALLLPAGAQARNPSPGAGAGRHPRQHASSSSAPTARRTRRT